ncbi:MAG: hypothetical protein V3V08_05620 [Nannocystaceae bacterium]
MTAEDKALARIAELEAQVAALTREFLKKEEEARERVAELEGAIAFAIGRLHGGEEGCPESKVLAQELRMLASERAGWIEVAVDANKALDAYLSEQGVEVPCGMPVDGVMQLVRRLKGE